MYKNELAIVSVKPEMGYGELGRKPDIAPDSRYTEYTCIILLLLTPGTLSTHVLYYYYCS